LSFSRAGGHAAQAPVNGAASQKSVTSDADGWTIKLNVNNGLITDAAIAWNNPSADKAFIDALARALKGKGLREARDHGVQYAYASLNGASPVKGIVIPRNYSDTSRAAVAALRKAIDTVEQPNPADWNFEDHGLSDTWRKIPKDERGKRLEAMIGDYAKKSGLTDAVTVTEIDQYDRVFVQFADDFPVEKKPSALMQLERYVRGETGERIELFVSELKDNNRIRRL